MEMLLSSWVTFISFSKPLAEMENGLRSKRRWWVVTTRIFAKLPQNRLSAQLLLKIKHHQTNLWDTLKRSASVITIGAALFQQSGWFSWHQTTLNGNNRSGFACYAWNILKVGSDMQRLNQKGRSKTESLGEDAQPSCVNAEEWIWRACRRRKNLRDARFAKGKPWQATIDFLGTEPTLLHTKETLAVGGKKWTGIFSP